MQDVSQGLRRSPRPVEVVAIPRCLQCLLDAPVSVSLRLGIRGHPGSASATYQNGKRAFNSAANRFAVSTSPVRNRRGPSVEQEILTKKRREPNAAILQSAHSILLDHGRLL